jgi:signal transduction histidine kinase
LVVASAAGVTILVAVALGWLGWRLLSQEHALEQQRRRDRLEQAADGLLTRLLRALTEAEIRLAQVGSAPPWNMPDPPSGGATVLIRPAGVEIRPAGALVYVPVLPAAAPFDESLFEEAEKFEFRDKDYARAESALRSLTTSSNSRVRAEARLRLARVQAKGGNTSQALSTYGQLRTEDILSSSEAPYSLLARFERCKLLASAGTREPLDRELADLLTALDAGRWPLRKDAYLYYVSEARAFTGRSTGSADCSSKLVLSDAVHTLWEEWESGGRRQLRPGRRVFGSGENRTLILTNSTPDRIAAAVYPQGAIRQLVAGAGWEEAMRDGNVGAVLDEDGKPILGSAPTRSSSIQASRTLAAAQIPWTLQLASSADADVPLLARRDRLYVAGLLAIALVVGLACYAMVRGVLREIRATRLQSDFVSAVSHEFRSPLTTLCQLTEMLAQGRVHDESRRRTYFDVLQKEAGRLNRLVENLLDFGRMEAGRRQYRPESVDLYELVREAVYVFQEEISGSGYGFELTGGAGIALEADREALRRVVRNLVENAVKYSPDSRTVWIEASQESGNAVLRVRDAGMGIAPQEQERVFDKFVRGQAAKVACIQGSGIGLAMVKEIVTAHQGEVHLASEVGQGSTFTVCLPLDTSLNGSVP